MTFNFENYKFSLLIERAAYVVRNMPEHVKLVDKELARLDGLLSTKHSRPLDVQVISRETESKTEAIAPITSKRKPTKRKEN